ncbi:hypothetical protein F753_09575 [Stutzerimonas chloritidismutans AW-1]|uniref:Uncharacterized protein n=1 Tax=Stutzerimonas chloritidismutans AW-1 TaxID=1263865 RepID=V4Q536_STUCH|nr:hypothetical protein F753_23730 [Stutzerimonas chloritidismutans AW-1]ESQ99629.1 hypothetical protein F753_09575 [Stutzerimonas chloritidismutans AW-1]
MRAVQSGTTVTAERMILDLISINVNIQMRVCLDIAV